jgi:hypothetical protein
VKIQIPSTLRKQLVDDWEFVNQQDKVSLKCVFQHNKKTSIKKCCNTFLLFLLYGCLKISIWPLRKDDTLKPRIGPDFLFIKKLIKKSNPVTY